jgi:hypothetical protein
MQTVETANIFLFQELGEWEWEKEVGGGGSNMIYLIHCKNLSKCYNVPTHSPTIKKN